jgi:hypothetical protein
MKFLRIEKDLFNYRQLDSQYLGVPVIPNIAPFRQR